MRFPVSRCTASASRRREAEAAAVCATGVCIADGLLGYLLLHPLRLVSPTAELRAAWHASDRVCVRLQGLAPVKCVEP